jgi:hypothetical protein
MNFEARFLELIKGGSNSKNTLICFPSSQNE